MKIVFNKLVAAYDAQASGTPDISTLNSEFAQLTGWIIPSFAESSIVSDPWSRLIPISEWPSERGETIDQLVIEPNIIDQNAQWAFSSASVAAHSPTAAIPNAGGFPPTYKLPNGFTQRPIAKENIAVDSPLFLIEDVMSSYNPQQQLTGYVNSMRGATQYLKSKKMRESSFALSQKAYYSTIVDGNPVLNTFAGKVDPNNASAADINTFGGLAVQPTGGLTTDLLANVYIYLSGSPQPNIATPLGWTETGDEVYPLILDPALKRPLVKDPQKLVRADLQYAFQGAGDMSPLLQPFTKALTIEGFAGQADFNMPRFNWVPASGSTPGGLEVVWPYVEGAAGTYGGAADRNPDWLTAGYGMWAVPRPGTMDMLVPRPASYDGYWVPQMYSLEITPRNIITPDTNPDGKLAFLRAIGCMAKRPFFPRQIVWGVAALPGTLAS